MRKILITIVLLIILSSCNTTKQTNKPDIIKNISNNDITAPSFVTE